MEIFGGLALGVFFLFLAYKLGFVKFGKFKEDKKSSSGGPGGGASSSEPGQQNEK